LCGQRGLFPVPLAAIRSRSRAGDTVHDAAISWLGSPLDCNQWWVEQQVNHHEGELREAFFANLPGNAGIEVDSNPRIGPGAPEKRSGAVLRLSGTREPEN
jgi:hypothetical protein